MDAEQRNVIMIPADKTGRKPRVAAYARVSSDSEDQLNSFTSQISHYARMVRENPGWEFAGMYADRGISGLSGNRPEFRRMLQDCMDGKIDTIIVKSISRFYRNTMEGLETIRELRSNGVNVIFEKESCDTGQDSDEVLLALHSLTAQRESISISSNLRLGTRMKMKNGTFRTASVPYGYRAEGNQLIIDGTKAAVVQRIYALYLSGTGMEQIARILTDEGVPTRYPASPWNRTSVSYILSNPAYAGDSLWQKTYTDGDTAIKRSKNNGMLPQYRIKNAHDAILDRETFQFAQLLIKARGDCYGNKGIAPPPFFNRKLRCSCCGSYFRVKQSDGERRWSCRKHDNASGNCPMMPVSESEIRQAFVRMYNNINTNRHILFAPIRKQLQALQDAKRCQSEKMKELQLRMRELKKQNVTIGALHDGSYISPEIFFEKITPIKNELFDLQRQKRRILEGFKKDAMLEGIELLINTLEEGPDWLEEFSEDLFSRIVDEIAVDITDMISIRLTGGLTVKERIHRGVRRGKI